MKKAAILGCVLGVAIAVAAAEPLSMTDTFALTTIDMLPTRGQLDGALGSQQEPNTYRLIAIAEDGSNDTGVRLRAISALPRYCPLVGSVPRCASSDPVHVALQTLVGDPVAAAQLTGKDLVLLRAAIESISLLQDPNDAGTIEGLLNHPSRDIRASAARALAAMCDSNAINPLRMRYQNESSDQVKLAISAALRILPCPVN
jgi:HEAT repeat protein